MLILALDTTLAACSAAIYDSSADELRAACSVPMARGHAESLAGMVEQLAADTGTGFNALERIAVTIGPGTFTGVRIGLAMARGLGVALGIPVVGVTTLQAIAANVTDNPGELPIAVVMDARRGAVYMQVFSHAGVPMTEPQCLAVELVPQTLPAGDLVLVGSGVDLIDTQQRGWQRSGANFLPDPEAVARLGAGQQINDRPPAPQYLRSADAKPQKPAVKLARVPVTITLAETLHAGVLSALHTECFPAAWSEQDLADLLSSPGVSALIATSQTGDRAPVGFILSRQAADEAEIVTMAVRPAMRRRGIAAQLLDATLERLKHDGSAKVFLEVRFDNAAALALYAAAGFAEAGRRPDYYRLEDGSRADAVIMALNS